MKRILWVLCALASVSAAEVPARPNIILILADDLGYGDVSCFGAPDIRTPHLDRMAREGMRCTDFYAASPLCSPTRASLMSGLYPQLAGVWKGVPDEKDREGLGLKPEIKLLPQILTASGYACGMVGKWHLGGNPPNIPNDRGFDSFFGFYCGHEKYGPRHQDLFLDRKPIEEEGHLTTIFTKRACDYVRAQKDKPFFLYLAYNAVHGPLDSAAALIPERVTDCVARGMTPERARYAAVVEHMDAGIGELLALLQELKLDGNTLVLFTSDNGADTSKWSGSNRPFRGEKGEVFEGGIRMASIWRWPGRIPSGGVSGQPCGTWDFCPTALEAAGIDVPAGLSGVSLLPALSAGRPLPERTLFFELKGRVAVREGRWKLVGDLSVKKEPKARLAAFELYDLGLDPRESRNLAGEHPEEVARLRGKLMAWVATFEPHKGLEP